VAVSQAKEYRRLILEAIEDMEFLATTFNTEKGEETKKAFKRGQKEACLKWAEILKERLNKLERSKTSG
jgi:hypothetical protein